MRHQRGAFLSLISPIPVAVAKRGMFTDPENYSFHANIASFIFSPFPSFPLRSLRGLILNVNSGRGCCKLNSATLKTADKTPMLFRHPQPLSAPPPHPPSFESQVTLWTSRDHVNYLFHIFLTLFLYVIRLPASLTHVSYNSPIVISVCTKFG